MEAPPPKKARSLAGLRAKKYGAGFENLFERTCRLQGLTITRIPDGCRQLGARRLIRVPTPCDWIVSWAFKTALLDTKTIDHDVFACSAITPHQVKIMAAHAKAGSGPAGYVIWLRAANQFFFLDAATLCELMETRGSFCGSHPKAILLGSGFDFDVRKIFTAEPY